MAISSSLPAASLIGYQLSKREDAKTMTDTKIDQRRAYRVVREDNGPRNPHTGLVSYHRTYAMAEEAVDTAKRSIRSRRGNETAYPPYRIERAVSVEYTDGSFAIAWETAHGEATR